MSYVVGQTGRRYRLIKPIAYACRDRSCASLPGADESLRERDGEEWVLSTHWHCSTCDAIYGGHTEHCKEQWRGK